MVELGDRRLELATSPAKLRRLLDEVLGEATPKTSPGPPGGKPDRMATDLTFAVAVGAGLLSFASPCVLPLVPAYVGQLTAVAVASRANGVPASRWTAVRHAAAYVLGFGLVFTILGVTATFAAAGLSRWMTELRQIGGILLIVLGPEHDRAPEDPRARASLATARCRRLGEPGHQHRRARARAGGRDRCRRTGREPHRRRPDRARRRVRARRGVRDRLDTLHRADPRLDPRMAATSTGTLAGGLLLIGYTLGLGIPFLLVAVFFDRAQPLLRPLIRHGRAVQVIGGLLVVAIGVLMLFDGLTWIVRLVPFNTGV